MRNLMLLAGIRGKAGREEVREAVRLAGLDPDDRRPVRKYSLGMRQRLGIAQAVMEDPEYLLLDEPMNGLDNEGVRDMRELFISLKNKGKTLLIASHSREDIEILCDRVYEMDKGRIALVR
jgi:ABC-2 type transport system ATP-binding protein